MMPPSENILVLDLETQRMFQEVGRGRLHDLKISVVGTYDYSADRYQAYAESEIPLLEERLKTAGLIVGFNIRRFDLEVLRPYLFLSVETLPVLDLLDEIREVRGHRVTLQSLAVGTLKISKSGSGANAVRLFQEGKLEELKRYCLDDVRITKEIFDYGRGEGRVYFRSDFDYRIYEVPVDWRDPLRKVRKAESFPTSLF